MIYIIFSCIYQKKSSTYAIEFEQMAESRTQLQSQKNEMNRDKKNANLIAIICVRYIFS